jgi:hypothetical protein
MMERHQDYVQPAVAVTANKTARFVIKLDVDAPFALRSLLFVNMNAFQFVITGFDDRRYSQGTPNISTDSLLQGGQFFPIYPQITFPIGMTIIIDVTDISGVGSTDGVLVFRGTKLYPDGVLVNTPKYPPKFSELNFRYGYSLSVPLGSAGTPTVLQNQPLNVLNDADFVVRMTSAFVQPGGDAYDPNQTSVILRDQYGKPYSNDWVPMHLLFPINSSAISPVQSAIPDAMIYPEIYLARNTQLLLDIERESGANTNTYNFVLHGSKIFSIA